jgi:hypothetical protein
MPPITILEHNNKHKLAPWDKIELVTWKQKKSMEMEPSIRNVSKTLFVFWKKCIF